MKTFLLNRICLTASLAALLALPVIPAHAEESEPKTVQEKLFKFMEKTYETLGKIGMAVQKSPPPDQISYFFINTVDCKFPANMPAKGPVEKDSVRCDFTGETQDDGKDLEQKLEGENARDFIGLVPEIIDINNKYGSMISLPIDDRIELDCNGSSCQIKGAPLLLVAKLQLEGQAAYQVKLLNPDDLK